MSALFRRAAPPAAVTSDAVAAAWLTSAEHYFWDVPRRVTIGPARPGPEAGSAYVVLAVGADQPDGPMRLLARRGDQAAWAGPVGQQDVEVLLWRGEGTEQDGIVRPPAPRPSARCRLTATRERAVEVARSAGSDVT